jgi:hypothetical protein
LAVQSLNLAIHNRIHGYDIIVVKDIIVVVFSAGFILFYFGLFIYDLIYNFMVLHNKSFKTYLFNNDPHYFRLEHLILIPILFVIGILWVLPVENILFKSIVVEVFFFLFLLLSGGNALFITIFSLVRECVTRRRRRVNFGDVEILNMFSDITHREKLFMFTKFAMTEWCAEEVYMLKEIINYKKFNSDERAVLTKKIYDLYLDENSEVFVNIPYSDIKTIYYASANNEYPDELFDRIQSKLIKKIYLPYNKFIRTYQEDQEQYRMITEVELI